ncbi:MAG: hypothetical protein ACK5XD_09860 [Acidobacteriota bacterium]
MKLFCLPLLAAALLAQDRPIPPPGVPVTEADQKELRAGIERLSGLIAGLGNHALLPDGIIFRDAVR